MTVLVGSRDNNCNYEMALHFDGENDLRYNFQFSRHR